jgi:hypothetical protein
MQSRGKFERYTTTSSQPSVVYGALGQLLSFSCASVPLSSRPQCDPLPEHSTPYCISQQGRAPERKPNDFKANILTWCARRDSNPHDFTHCHLKAARLPIPPRAQGSDRHGVRPGRIDGADVTNQGWRDKAQRPAWRTPFGLPGAGGAGQHLLDFHRDPVAVHQNHAAGDGQVVGENLDLVLLGGVQFDDGAAAEPHYLMNGHRGGAEHHHEVDRDFIEGWHF